MDKITHRRPDARKPRKSKSKRKLKREILEDELGERSDRFFKELDKLEGKEYCETYLSAAKHVVPSLKSVDYKDSSDNKNGLVQLIQDLCLKENEINKGK